MSMTETIFCIYCDEPLSKWENTRTYCWNCNGLTSVTFEEDESDN